MRKALLCDTFLCSSNAISDDGQLVNIDNYGNRTAAMIFWPKQVTLVAGINKVVKTVEDALVRARTIAAPMNIQRFPSIATPCNKTGEDYGYCCPAHC
jgi:L-lactate utilization protein LutB